MASTCFTVMSGTDCSANCIFVFAIHLRRALLKNILEKDHTQTECDSVYALCERAIRSRNIYVLGELENIKRTYLVQDFFKSYTESSYYSSIRPGLKAGDSVVKGIRQLLYTNKETSSINLITMMGWVFIPLPRRIKENTGVVKQKYRKKPAIKSSKYQHLQELKRIIPADYHQFYDSLPHAYFRTP